MTILVRLAELVGFAVLGFVALMVVVTAVSATHEFIRSRWRAYDLWFYDDVRRWNRRRNQN